MIAPILAKTVLPLASWVVRYLIFHPKTAERAFDSLLPIIRAILSVHMDEQEKKTATTKAPPEEPVAGG